MSTYEINIELTFLFQQTQRLYRFGEHRQSCHSLMGWMCRAARFTSSHADDRVWLGRHYQTVAGWTTCCSLGRRRILPARRSGEAELELDPYCKYNNVCIAAMGCYSSKRYILACRAIWYLAVVARSGPGIFKHGGAEFLNLKNYTSRYYV